MDIRASRLQSDNDAYGNIVDAFDEIVDIVNSEGGLTVYGWVKRGFINDVSILGNGIKEPGDNRVLSQDIFVHVVNLHTSKKYYLGISTIYLRSLDNLEFDFSTL